MSGPNIEFGESYFAVELAGYRWPLRLRMLLRPEPRVELTCGRGLCRTILVKIVEPEVWDWSFRVDELGALAADHLPGCDCGKPPEARRTPALPRRPDHLIG